MILTAKALLDANQRPSRERMMKALEANYCRCAGFSSIFKAVDRAAAALRGEAVSPPPLPPATAGRRWPRARHGTARTSSATECCT